MKGNSHWGQCFSTALLGISALLLADPIRAQQPLESSATDRFSNTGIYISVGTDNAASRDLKFSISNPEEVEFIHDLDSTSTSAGSEPVSVYRIRANASHETVDFTQNDVGALGLNGTFGEQFDSGVFAELEFGYRSTGLSTTARPNGNLKILSYYLLQNGVKKGPSELCKDFGITASECEKAVLDDINNYSRKVNDAHTSAKKLRTGRFSEISTMVNLGLRPNSEYGIRPFFLGGIGLVSQRLSLDPLTLSTDETTKKFGSPPIEEKKTWKMAFPGAKKTNASLGYQLKAGLEIDFNPNVSGVAALRYVGGIGDKPDFRITGSGNGLSLSTGIRMRF